MKCIGILCVVDILINACKIGTTLLNVQIFDMTIIFDYSDRFIRKSIETVQRYILQYCRYIVFNMITEFKIVGE